MVWFKVDDGFYDHPKFLEMPNAAIGLWVKAGAWCARHLTDGVIPAAQVTILKGTKSQIDALIMSGVWVQTESQMGGKAYRFHDWNDHQPTRSETLKAREDASERKRKSREQKAPKQEQHENVTRDTSVTGTRDSHVRHKGVSHDPDPTRPDPTRPIEDKESARAPEKVDPPKPRSKPRTRIPDGWHPTESHIGYCNERGIDLSTEATAFVAHAQANDRTLANWNAGFTQWLTKARPRQQNNGYGNTNRPGTSGRETTADMRARLSAPKIQSPNPTVPDYASGHDVIDVTPAPALLNREGVPLPRFH